MADKDDVALQRSFRAFQLRYLCVYLTVMLADWLQGTNMYTLYQSYGVDIGLLFITGFSSSAVFGTFLGLYVDRFGRKFGCIVFCILEIIINWLEHYPNIYLLLIGRVLGGISTSLLFSAFESWMVSAHRINKYPEEWLATTFSYVSIGNGIVAIIAGIVAQIAANNLGDIGPFQLAIALTVLSLIMVLPWKENYGHMGGRADSTSDATATAASAAGGDEPSTADRASWRHAQTISLDAASPEHHQHLHTDGKAGDSGKVAVTAKVGLVRCVLSSPSIVLLGLSQSLFEGGMYTFVFLWVPRLQQQQKLLYSDEEGGVNLPTGLIFAAFMVCVTAGGLIFRLYHMLSERNDEAKKEEKEGAKGGSQKGRGGSFCGISTFTFFTLLVSSASLFYASTSSYFYTTLAAFFLFETTVGIYFACFGTLRSRYIPDHLQTSIMNVFRVPLNGLVIAGTKLCDTLPLGTVLVVCGVWLAMGAVCVLLIDTFSGKSKSKSKSEGVEGSEADSVATVAAKKVQ